MSNLGVVGMGGVRKSALGTAQQMALMAATSLYAGMPMEKAPKPERCISIVACAKCGAGGTLKKVGKDEYNCLKCSGRAGTVNE